MKLSVIIITKNEAHNLPKALASVSFADEVIVVDSGSTDDTVRLAEQAGAKVVTTSKWPGYGPQKNYALSLAMGDWVLSLDADEWLSPELSHFIQRVISRPLLANGNPREPVAYRLARRSIFIDKLICWGDWRRDRVVRLFRRDCAQFSDDVVHERLEVRGPVVDGTGFLMHHPFRSIQGVIDKMYVYNGLAANRLVQRGRGGPNEAWARAFFTFLRCAILRLGFLDGYRGLQLAWYNAKGTWLRYRFAGEQLAQQRWESGARHPLDRFQDWQNLLLTDHGVLRLFYRNRFRLAGGLFRSNQPMPYDIQSMVRRYGVRTVVNLRGLNPQQGWFRLEANACDKFGVTRRDAVVYSRGLLTATEMGDLRDLIQSIELPALVHCKSGADRAGFFSVLYRHFRLGEPVEEARKELALRYGHFKAAKTGVLDAFFDQFLQTRETRQSLDHWIRARYSKEWVEEEFHPRGLASWLVDQVLVRE